MKQICYLFFFFLSYQAFGQSIHGSIPEYSFAPNNSLKSDSDQVNKAIFNNKLFRDTAYYEDFDTANFVSNGWTITNNNQNLLEWENTSVFKPGQFSTLVPRIKSSTVFNGFMLVNGDFYNTPIPATGVIVMDTKFTSDTIFLDSINSNSVWVTYQDYLRYCCSSANDIVLEVSSDKQNWYEYDAKDGLAVNLINADTSIAVVHHEINVTDAVCGNSFMFLRFRVTGSSHYFWMIDDLAVIEGPEHNLKLEDYEIIFSDVVDTITVNPFYTRIPQAIVPALGFSGIASNQGELTESNVELNVEVHHLADENNKPGSGNGLEYSNSVTIDTLYRSCYAGDSSYHLFLIDSNKYLPKNKGFYRADFNIDYDSSSNEATTIDNSASQSFEITDTIYSRDDNVFEGTVGPHDFFGNGTPGGTSVGDRLALLYYVELDTSRATRRELIPTSVSFYVSNNSRNVGVEIVPKIWVFNASPVPGASFIAQEIASKRTAYRVQASDTNTVLTLPLDRGIAISGRSAGLVTGFYAIGWETTNIAATKTFEVWNDASTAEKQPYVSAYVDLGHNRGWGWINANPAIRLNFGNLPNQVTGIEENPSSNHFIYPNPNRGIFNVHFDKMVNSNYKLSVRNSIGQVVLTKQLNSSVGEMRIDLGQQQQGVYYVIIESQHKRTIDKVVIH